MLRKCYVVQISILKCVRSNFFLVIPISTTNPLLAKTAPTRLFTQQIPTIPQRPQVPSPIERREELQIPPASVPMPEIPKINREKLKLKGSYSKAILSYQLNN